MRHLFLMKLMIGRIVRKQEQELQLELPLNNPALPHARPMRTNRIARARWWFRAMHRAIEEAFEWTSPVQEGPEQGRLALSPELSEPVPWSYSSSNSR
ncbi:MAG: hypothetical protein GX456_13900 [Verrucomicrobia bacterium]|nr:hypothetical protein [Verrucomicrobiota bacterium]